MLTLSASMNRVNERSMDIHLRDFMEEPEGWGRAQGREVYQRLLDFIESNPGIIVFRVSMKGVRRLDISFASETLIELARRYRGSRGFCLIDLDDVDMIENWEAAASKKKQPLTLWHGTTWQIIGDEPSEGNRQAFLFALNHSQVRAADFAHAMPDVSITNASTKFKQLWSQGFLLRQERVADSGGVEFVYQRIG
jgi:hypothetical protein